MRDHSGGYIKDTFYFNIGTEEARGRDGESSRTAAQKYNDHKHPAAELNGFPQIDAWSRELQMISQIDGVPGGILTNDSTKTARSLGDLASMNGHLFAYTGPGIASPITCGLGGRLVTQNNVTSFEKDVLIEQIPIRVDSGIDLANLPLNNAIDLSFAKGFIAKSDYRVANAESSILLELVAGIRRPSDVNLTAIEQKLFQLNNELVRPTVVVISNKEEFQGNQVPIAPANPVIRMVRTEYFLEPNPWDNNISYELSDVSIDQNVENGIYFISYRRATPGEIYTGSFDQGDIISANYNNDAAAFESDLEDFWATCTFDILSVRLKIKNTFGAGL